MTYPDVPPEAPQPSASQPIYPEQNQPQFPPPFYPGGQPGNVSQQFQTPFSLPYQPYNQSPRGLPLDRKWYRSQHVLVASISAILVVALIGIVVIAMPHTSPKIAVMIPATATQPAPTETPFPTATPTPAPYSAQIPGSACDPLGDWTPSQSGSALCSSQGLNVVEPASASGIFEEQFNQVAFPSDYTVSVSVSNIANGCAGIEVLTDNYKGYAVYVCIDNIWTITRYDATGHPSVVDYGVLSDNGNPYNLEVTVSGSTLTFVEGVMQLSSITILPSYQQTSFIGLVVSNRTNYDASVTFSNYAYTPNA
jgi:hypothetical protein